VRSLQGKPPRLLQSDITVSPSCSACRLRAEACPFMLPILGVAGPRSIRAYPRGLGTDLFPTSTRPAGIAEAGGSGAGRGR
jgi:hypothetical protein